MSAATSAIQQLASGNVLGAVAAGAAAVGVAMVGAVQSAGQFQSGLTSLVTGAGEAQSNLKAVGDGILKISTDTGTSTKSLTDAMYLIESSGQHGAAGLQVLQTAAEGARVGNADLATTANALTTVLTDYHQPASAATGDMNALITAVADGKTHMQDMASAMGSVLPLASSLGISFPQVSGAIAVMTNAGMDAQRASQNLANAIRSLAAPNAAAQKSMTAVGLSAQQLKDTLTTQGLAGAIQLIEDHVGKKFPAGSVQAVEAFKAIMGGATGYNVALMLGGQNMSAYEANIKNITAAMDAGGNSVQGWALVQQNFNFQLERAQAALQAFMIILGEKLLPILTPIVKGFADIVTNITNFVTSLSDAKNPGDSFVKTLTSMGVNAQTARDIFNDLSTAFRIIGQIVSDVGNILQTTFGMSLKVVGGLIVAFINGPLDDILQGFNAILSGIADFTDQLSKDLQTAFDGLSSDAQTWGANFGISFENGIISVASDIIATVEQIAQDIADYLGFQSPTKKGPGSTLGRWGIGMVSGLAQGIIAAGPMITNAVLSVASQLQTASTSGGILHTAVTSMIDPLSGDAMKATVTPDAAISHPNTGLNTTALKSATASHSTATNATTAVATAVRVSASAISSAVTAGASTVSSVVTATASKASAQKSATSSKAAAQRTAAAAQRAAHTAAMQKAHQQAAQQRAEAAKQRQAAAAQRAQQHAAATAQRAKLHTEAQAKREQIHQALLQQRAEAKAAKAAAKAGPPAVAGAMPSADLSSISNALNGIKQKITDAFSPLKDAAANAKLLGLNISNSFTGIQAKAQQLQADLKQFFDWLNRTFAPVWAQISDTWNNHIIPDLAKIKKSFDDASPSLKDIVKILGQLLSLGLVAFFQNLADTLYIVDYIIERLADALTLMVQQWLWVQQQLKPIYDWIVQGLQWVYDQIIGHSIIPDLINGIKSWFNQLINFFPNLMGKIKSTLVQWWNQIKSDVTTFWQNVQSIFSSAWQTYIQKPLQTLNTNFQQWFTTEATNFGTWGTNLIKMFAQGLTTASTTILQPAVNAVATTIKNFLGIQSPAAMGPLSKSDTWMSNLMKMFSGQITAGTPKVTSATNAMASSVQQSIDQMSQKVQQSVSDMMMKISQVGQSLSQMQSQVSAAVNIMRSDVQIAVSNANMAITNMESQVANSVSSMNQQIASVGQSISQMQSAVTNSIQQAQQSVQSATKAMEASLQQLQNKAASTATNVQTSDNAIQKSNDQVIANMNQSGQDISNTFKAIANAIGGMAEYDKAQLTQSEADLQKAKASNDQMGTILAQMKVDVQQAGLWLDQTLQKAAMAAAAVMGHTEPSSGPLAGDSQWGVHFMQNFVSGMQSQIPALAKMSQSAATKVVENFLPNTKGVVTDIKTALSDAANAMNATITSFKQKGDDIYATIQGLASLTGGTAGTPGTAATYALTTANVRGDIPVQYQLTPPTPGTAGTPGTTSTQNMTIHIDLDGKTLGKYVGTYVNKELHVQGAIRNR